MARESRHRLDPRHIVLVGGLACGLVASPGAAEDSPEAINQRVQAILGDGSGEAQDGAAKAEEVSGQVYLPADAIRADVINGALADMLDQQAAPGEKVAVHHSGKPLNFEIHFRKNTADLTNESKQSLDELGQVLQQDYLDHQFILGGHTDLDGDASVNDPLSKARAESARAYLIEQYQIAPDRLVAKGFGTTEPLRPVEESIQDKLYNRRVDLRPAHRDQ